MILRLPPGPSAHVSKVLRLRAGALLTVFNGRGGEFEAQVLSIEREGVQVRVGAHDPIEREAPFAVSLLQCLARAERMDWIVQKATELGVTAIVPVESAHSVVRLDESGAQRRASHWEAVAISACEQCGRNRVPTLQPAVPFERACADASSTAGRLMLDTQAGETLTGAVRALSATALKPALSLLIGPEGGFSAPERASALHYGFIPCTLGPRILRAETAPLAALAAIQAVLGDFA
jgi:16S rRNA (uracil1498-N3)-methyltransferase